MLKHLRSWAPGRHAIRLFEQLVGGVRNEACFCPVCRSQPERFAEHRGRKAARCPECGSLERHRFSVAVLEDRLKDPSKLGRVLHFAPERAVGAYLRKRANRGYVTCDLSARRVDVNCDIANTPFADSEFDLIYCSHVLEHVPHDRSAMRELFRITKPGGMALIMVPIGAGPTDEDPAKAASPELRKRYYGQDDHVRRYGMDIVERLEEARFRTEVVSTTVKEYSALREKFGFLPKDYVFWAVKPIECGQRAPIGV